MGKLAYLRRSIAGQFVRRRFHCPSCGCSNNTVVSRKYVITQLRRCANCELLFRTPTDDPSRNLDYYEDEYSQGFTTDLPTDESLTELIKNDFAGSEKSWAYYNDVLRRLGLDAGARIFDFGCSWGYGSYQMARAGYSVLAFEIAPTRRRYAEQKLRVITVADMEKGVNDPNLAGTFDCFFCAHVLEHIPSPAAVFRVACALLRPGGVFVSFTPNGSQQARAFFPEWEKWWGEVHPNFIDDSFLDRAFDGSPRVIGSSPVGAIDFPSKDILGRLDDLSGEELFFAARRK
jgi:2-polyprenyl-3-methyl-5-hydroxy-6-metoxy-1,4-benzoquinol methylase